MLNVLPALRCSIHGIWGACDATIGPHIMERISFMHGLSPHSMALVIEDAGHWVAFEAPNDFNNALLPLLAKGPST
jgi:2-hydroxy-6-oxonona-2,4-dienedioate hydrolase